MQQNLLAPGKEPAGTGGQNLLASGDRTCRQKGTEHAGTRGQNLLAPGDRTH